MSLRPAPSRYVLPSFVPSHSASTVEAVDAALVFIRSSFCQGGLCVEVAQDGDEILLRDGKDTSVAPLRFTKDEWRQFLAQCREA